MQTCSVTSDELQVSCDSNRALGDKLAVHQSVLCVSIGESCVRTSTGVIIVFDCVQRINLRTMVKRLEMQAEALSSCKRVDETYVHILKSINRDILYPAEISNRTGIPLQQLFSYLDSLRHVGHLSFSSDGFGAVYFLTEMGSKAVKEYTKEHSLLISARPKKS